MTLVLAAAFVVAHLLGDPDGSLLTRWLWNLTQGSAIDASPSLLYRAVGAHLAVGVLLGIVYDRYFRPVLTGAEWLRGAQFSLFPWLLSVGVLLPIAGAGSFGLSLGAGPLPAAGSLILHLVYGSVLGWTLGQSVTWSEDGVARGRRRG